MSAPGSTLIAVDAHVHLHDAFVRQLDLAASFRRAAAAAGAEPDVLVWMLATMPGQDGREVLETLAREARDSAPELAQEGGVALLRVDLGGKRLLVINGRQIRTAERLEVLALATDAIPPDDRPLEETVTNCLERGAVTVIPWGVGKWLGERGRTVERVFDRMATVDGANERLRLADNAHRPGFWPRPAPFAAAEAKGMAVLSGSDPLALQGEHERIGTAGIVARCGDRVSLDDVRRSLARPERRYGARMPLVRFVRLQAGLRTRSDPQ